MSRKTGYHFQTPESLKLFETLYRYKYLRTSFLSALTGSGSQGIVRQLKRRRDQGFITKPREQLRAYNNINCPRIHSLTKKGEEALIEHDRHPLKATRLGRKPSDAPAKNFAHSMMICDATASIEIGVIENNLEFIPWTQIIEKVEQPDPMRLEFDFTYKGKRPKKNSLYPDGLFGIRYPNGQVSFFALEAEHFSPIEPSSDIERSSTLKKLLGYQDIIKNKKYQHLGIPNLRVLFVYPTHTRATHAKELAERLFGSTNMFLFHHVPVQEETLKPPPPFPELLTSSWMRAGMDSTQLYTDPIFTESQSVVV